jgi:hypothetical protein
LNSNLLSAKALGLLFFITSTDTRISAENLSSKFGEGEKAIASGLRELRDHGLTELKYEKIGGKPIKFTIVTDLGWETIANYLRMPTPNSPYIFETSRNPQNGGIDTVNEQLSKLILNIYKYKPNTFREEETSKDSQVNTRGSHESGCQKCFGEATPLEQRLETEKTKQAAFDAKKQEKHRVALQKRQGRPKSTWSISDVCMEIAERAANIWSLPPWRLSESRLVVAFTQVRRKWGTNGEIEIHALDFFLKRADSREFPSVDALWQAFVYQFPEILPKVKAMYPSGEDLKLREETKEISERKLREFLDDSNSGPTREESSARQIELKRIASMVHHFKTLEAESRTSGDLDSAERYKKTYLKYELDAAIVKNDNQEINNLRTLLECLTHILEIPDGEYSV